jgi:hypothetical protein
MRGIRTTMVVTWDWYPEPGEYSTDLDLLEAGMHDARIYQNDPVMCVEDYRDSSKVNVSISLIEGNPNG